MLRGESSLDKGPNTLPPALLTALAATTKAFESHEPVYDTLTPIHVWIRAYVTESSGSLLCKQMLEKEIADAILITTKKDSRIIAERKIRKSVDIGEMERRKFFLFKGINANFFVSFYDGEYPRNSMMITMDKIESLGSINLQITDSLNKAFKKLKILNDAQSEVSNNFDQMDECTEEYDKYLHLNRMNKRGIKQLGRKIFPERTTVSTQKLSPSLVFFEIINENVIQMYFIIRSNVIGISDD